MRNIKTLLKLLGAVSLSTVAASSVVACGAKTPESHADIAKLLGWYDTDGKSLIVQKLNYDSTVRKEKYSIIADDSLIKPTALFKTKLLVQGSVVGKFKAKNVESAKLLYDLGFKSGNESQDYSDTDVTSITSLSAVLQNNNSGKIEKKDTTDFKVASGTCQIEVKSNNTVLKKINIKTKESDLLVPSVVSQMIQKSSSAWNITFEGTSAYKQNQPVIKQLPWNSDTDGQKAKKQFKSLCKLLGLVKNSDILVHLSWSSDSQGKQIINTYTNAPAFLTIMFGDIKVWGPVNCGTPPA
ncbi:hypothetical protein [Spiroplasma endosymbiont of Nomada rufipes]|uniref:hypothetical protein n=1 Tax=Spiroplasma endosymbiont of Nomada rufipes TaxID=3077933 RepID=UPI00376EA943